MKKLLLIFGFLIIGIAIAAVIVWSGRANLAAQFLSRHLNHVPVTLNALDISKTKASLSKLWIGNPPRSKTKTAFSAEAIEIDADFTKIFKDPLILDEIHLEKIFVGLEFYNAVGTESNWAAILKSKAPKKKPSRGWLIRRLVLENLTVQVTQSNGQVKRYPTIPRLEFRNISSESGFPIEEIEKAIFNLMMQELFQKLNLDQLFQGLQKVPGSPLKYFPNPFK